MTSVWLFVQELCFILMIFPLWAQKNEILSEDDDLTVVFKSSTGTIVTEKDLDTFKKSYNLKKDIEVEVQEISPNNSISYGGKVHNLDYLDKVIIFTPAATYIRNGVEGSPPETFIYKMEDRDQIMTVSKSPSGEIKDITFTYKTNGMTVALVMITSRIFVTIQESDYDLDLLNLKFSYANAENQDLVVDVEESGFTATPSKNPAFCTFIRTIDLAVAYESSFCSDNGGSYTNADDAVTSLVAKVSAKFQQDDLCTEVKISHLEGFCNADTDPYRTYVELNRSGCGNIGLLDGFQTYWRENRGAIARDVAHLFTGTGLQCENGDCIIGCAFKGTLCVLDSSYGVEYLTYTSDDNLRAVTIAHELGHSCGASHFNEANFIMTERVNAASNGFSETSINAMKGRLNAACISNDCRSTSKRFRTLIENFEDMFNL